MSYEDIDDAADARHNTPPVSPPWQNEDSAPPRAFPMPDSNDHQEPAPGFVPREAFGEPVGPLPVRNPNWRPDPQGLQWHFGNGFPPLVGLASTDWASLRDLPNVELRTIHAHLMEAISQARGAMRDRGMVVDF